jgi:hypothetical protein
MWDRFHQEGEPSEADTLFPTTPLYWLREDIRLIRKRMEKEL